MHQKSKSARESFTLQSPSAAQSSFRQSFQSNIKISPIGSPRAYLHIKTPRSSATKDLTSGMSPTSPKKGFFFKDGFSPDGLDSPKTQRNPVTNNFVAPKLQINHERPLTSRSSKNPDKQKEIYALSSRKVSLASNQEDRRLLIPTESNYSPIDPRFIIQTPRSMTSRNKDHAPKKPSLEISESELKKVLLGSPSNGKKPLWRHNDVTKFLADSSPKANRKPRNTVTGNKFFWSNANPKIAQQPLKSTTQVPKSARTLSNPMLTIRIHQDTQNELRLNTGNTLIDSPKTFWNSLNLAASPKEGYGSVCRSNYQSTMDSGPFDGKSLKSWSNLDTILAKQRSEVPSPGFEIMRMSHRGSPVKLSRNSFSGYSFLGDNFDSVHLKTEYNENPQGQNFHRIQEEIEIDINMDRSKPMNLVQKNVYKIDSKTTRLQTLPNEADDVHKKIEELQVHFSKQTIAHKTKIVERSNADYEEMFKSGRRRLNALDIRTIKLEFNKKASKHEVCEYAKLDSIVNELKFFTNLDKLARILLLKAATYKSYSAGEVIFNQGEEGQLIYIILRGAVNIKMTRKNKYEDIETVSLGVLYDGYHFGENALLLNPHKDEKANNETIKSPRSLSPPQAKSESIPVTANVLSDEFCEIRAVTAIVSESCDLLCIPRKDYKMICANFIQKYVDQKLRALKTLPFLSDLDEYTLLPLANDLVYKKYEYGEIILAAEDEVDKFRIISTGKCALLLGYACSSSPKSNQNSKSKRLASGLVDYTCKQTSTRETSPSNDNKLIEKSPKIHQYSTRSFNQEKLGFCDGRTTYLEHMSFGVMAKGGFFGGRALLTRGDFTDDEAEHEKLPVLSEPARVSVVADSASVEIFELSKENFDSLPEFLAKIIIQGLKIADEFDNFEIEAKIEEAGQWIKFKEKELKELRVAK